MYKSTSLTRPSLDCLRLRRLRRTLRHICGKLDGLPGPKRREKRNTLSGRKSGNSSRTSTFAYFDGNIAANGVSNFRSDFVSSPLLLSLGSVFVASPLQNCNSSVSDSSSYYSINVELTSMPASAEHLAVASILYHYRLL